MEFNQQILNVLTEISNSLKTVKEQTVTQKPSKVFWQPFTFTNNQTRVFYGNAIVFNNQGTGKVYINNIFMLDVGDTLTLSCDQNEIDYTEYSISFATGAINKLGVMVKANEGVRALIFANDSKLVAPPSRRKTIKQYTQQRKRGIF